MKIHPNMEEVLDLRHRIHIMNAEKFIDVKKEHRALVEHINLVITATHHACLTTEAEKKFEMLKNKGNYLSVRGSSNFVRYTYRLIEVNNALRRILTEMAENNMSSDPS